MAADTIRGLISVLLDRRARLDERDDAAMNLSQHPSEEALQALVAIATDPDEDEILLESCGESIADIWLALDRFDKDTWNQLAPPARHDAASLLQKHRPLWILPNR